MKYLHRDVNLGLLILVLCCVSCIAAFSIAYSNSFLVLQNQNDQDMAKLTSIQKQLILKEQELESMRLEQQNALSERSLIHSNLLNLESEYQTLRIEKKPAVIEQPRPFSKAFCKTSGNATC